MCLESWIFKIIFQFLLHSGIFLEELTSFIVQIDDASHAKKTQIALETEVDTLREKLAAMEAQLVAQKSAVAQILPRISDTHKAILKSRDKYLKLSSCCQRVGGLVKGSDYQ